MYVIKRTNREQNTISYYKYEGWVDYPMEGPLDLNGCVLFTVTEAAQWVINRTLASNEEFQWYGAYKR